MPSTIGSLSAIPASAEPQDRPDAKREALLRMEPLWELPDLLMGGTRAMHEAKDKVLIREQDETNEEFDRRISRTALSNFYGETIARHASKPFAKEIVFDPPLPEALRYLEANADGCGRSITVFFREVLFGGMHRGLCHVLVDVQPGAGETYKDVLNRRPLLHRIDAPALLDVDEQPDDQEAHVTYARFHQTQVAQKGRFGRTSVQTIMEIETDGSGTGTTTIYTPKEGGGWLAAESEYRRATVPLFTFYADQTGPHEAKPAYLPLAELNLLHFQSDADQRHALSYGRRATVVQTGWKQNSNPADAAARGGVPSTQKSALGYGRRQRHDNDGAKAYLLETTGKPLEAGANDLKALEERMERFGASQVSKGGGITATSRRLDNQDDTCNLEAWCTRIERVALQALRAAAAWRNVQLPADQKVLVDRSFADDTPPSADVPHLVTMARDKTLPLRTLYAELKARNVLLTVKDPDVEVSVLADESEKLGLAGFERLASRMKGQREPEQPPVAPVEGDAA